MYITALEIWLLESQEYVILSGGVGHTLHIRQKGQDVPLCGKTVAQALGARDAHEADIFNHNYQWQPRKWRNDDPVCTECFVAAMKIDEPEKTEEQIRKEWSL
jgi:hypothetical protein